MDHVFLIPGFFGFSTLGQMRYFAHVHRALGAALEGQGVEAALHDVPTLPTASLQRRARRLAEVVRQTAARGDAIHLVGHSTGGLDARLLLCPASAVGAPADWDPLARQVRSVTSVATPHQGVPLAAFFATAQGERWLRLLSILTLQVVRLGRFATTPTSAVLSAVRRAGALHRVEPGLLDQVWRDVLRDFDADRQQTLRTFFEEVWRDRSLLRQLTPRGLSAVTATLRERPGVAYGSVVLRACPPDPARAVRAELRASHRLYSLLHELAGWEAPPPPPQPEPSQADQLAQTLGDAPTERDNDGIVPTLSQLHRELIWVAGCDHLDVLGHFHGPAERPPHIDWLRTHSDFDRPQFEAVWGAVAQWIARAR